MKDSDGNILWSWHIWCTDQPGNQVYKNAENKYYTLLDRNLGAISNSSADGEASYGLLYQWGRKDPFQRTPEVLAEGNKMGIYSNAIAKTIAHPNVFVISSKDWMSSLSTNNYLWGNPFGYNYNSTVPYSSNGQASGTLIVPSKSIYDPCPPGYMVPPKDTWTYFSTSPGTWDSTNKGRSFDTNAGGTIWYPAAGIRFANDGTINGSGSTGEYWSSSPNSSESEYAGELDFNIYDVDPLKYRRRANGISVRCVKDL